tara:strand:+ start:214 stop:648 length:435 start_codon:yes stop_codon:yes gene_type:complete
MENQEIKHKSLYLQLLRENHIWKKDSKTIYSLHPKLKYHEVTELYKKFVEENEEKVDEFINFTLDNAVDSLEKSLLTQYFGLFRDNKRMDEIAKEQNVNSYSLSKMKDRAMYKIKYKLKSKEDFQEQKKTIDKLIKKYETELTQ